MRVLLVEHESEEALRMAQGLNEAGYSVEVAANGMAAQRFVESAKYDLVFDLQGLGRSGLFSLCTRAPRRVGYRDARELGWLGVNVHVERGQGMQGRRGQQ